MNEKRHATEDEVLDCLFEDPAEEDARARTERHLETCEACRNLAATFREVVGGLEDPAAWLDQAGNGASTDASLLERFRGLEAQTLADEEHAERVVGRILTGPPNAWGPNIADTKEPITRPLVAKILEAAHESLDRDPAKALELAVFARDLCPVLPKQALAVLGDAWKEEANALRYLGRLEEGHAALDRAVDAYSKTLVPDPDLAAVGYVRALLLWSARRFDEALAEVRRAAPTLRQFGDLARSASCHSLEAGILFERGDYQEARSISAQLLANGELEDDLSMKARTLTNLGHCDAHLGHFEAASTGYLQALSIFEELDLAGPRASLRWSLADVQALAGRFTEAIPLYEQAERSFEELEMIGDAATVSLHRAEAMLAAGISQPVPAICRAAIERFTEIGVEERVREALAFLREALNAGRVSVPALHAVTAFLERAPREPDLVFARPSA